MTNKIKWEEHYDDLLFDFIQFRSEHPNGNLSDSIKDFKNYMTKEEQPFKWSDELVKEYGEWYKITQGNLNTYSDLWGKDLFKFFKDMHLIKQQTNTIPSGEPKPMNDFMEETKITVPSQPKTERIEVRTDDGNVVYTKEQLREAERRAFNAARGINLEKAYHRQYATFEDYKKLNP